VKYDICIIKDKFKSDTNYTVMSVHRFTRYHLVRLRENSDKHIPPDPCGKYSSLLQRQTAHRKMTISYDITSRDSCKS
jgi:hypothetical protein